MKRKNAVTPMADTIKIPYGRTLPQEKLRPLINIEVKNIGAVSCVIDSGADMSVFPFAIGEAVGVDFEEAEEGINVKCVHGHETRGKIAAMNITVWGETFALLCTFLEKVDKPLLGRMGSLKDMK